MSKQVCYAVAETIVRSRRIIHALESANLKPLIRCSGDCPDSDWKTRQQARQHRRVVISVSVLQRRDVLQHFELTATGAFFRRLCRSATNWSSPSEMKSVHGLSGSETHCDSKLITERYCRSSLVDGIQIDRAPNVCLQRQPAVDHESEIPCRVRGSDGGRQDGDVVDVNLCPLLSRSELHDLFCYQV